MSYCTQIQLQDRFGADTLVALTDRGAVALGDVDLDVLTRALADTDALIDGFLAGRYGLPLLTVPALISSLAQDIVHWKLHLGEPSAKVKSDYDAAMKSLRDISSGVIRIPEATGLEPAAPGTSGVVVTDRERPFTADNMKGFI